VHLPDNVEIVAIAIQFFILLYSLTIHEASHAWMSDRLGDSTARYQGRVSFNPISHIDPIGTVVFPLLGYFNISNFPLIGWAKPVPVNSLHLRNPQKDQIFISLAGPASNILAGCAAFIMLILLKMFVPPAGEFVDYVAREQHISPQHSFLAPVVGILFFAFRTNIALAIFNLIPIPPLDGHWVLYGLLPPKAAEALESIGSYGFIILLVLMYFGMFGFISTIIYWMRVLLVQW
jgi:Zn-dependent protease